MTAKWVKSVPSFQLLPAGDQDTLFRQSWRKLFTLGCAQFLTVPDLEQFQSCSSVTEQEMCSFLHSVSTLRSLGLSQAEYSCLRAVLLFKCEEGTACHARHSIAAHSEQAVLILAQSLPAQFARVMLVLAGVEGIMSSTVHDLFFRDTIGQVDMEMIVMDMIKNVS